MLGLAFGTGLSGGASLGGGALTALASLEEKVPNEAAVKIAPQVGWLMLVGGLAIVALFIVNSELWRRWWLTKDDPRSVGIWRIVFGFFVIANMNDFWEYFIFLFTDEGIFTADVARQVHASAQFVGFGDGMGEDDPWGFFDFWAVVEFLKGPKYSLLYIWDSPKFFWAHLWTFQVCAALFLIGWRTRLMGILTFFLMNSIFFRNHLFWEGTELIYRVFLAYLICAKCGHAYSVDNWLRCRRLRKKGLLSTRDGPGGGAGVAPSEEHPKGLQAIYRLIPAWPRRLAIVQMCAMYADTGILKNGSVWARGDAVYYAWNMDHFYRFYPQQITAALGTNVMRLVAWYSHWGEALFFTMIIGVLTYWGVTEKVPKLRGWRINATRLCWATIIAITAAIIWVTWPVHFVPQVPRTAFVSCWVMLLIICWAIWAWVGHRPLRVSGLIGVLIGWAALAAIPAILIWVLWPPHLLRFWGARLSWTLAWPVAVILVPLLIRRIRNKSFFSTTLLTRRYNIDRLWIARWIFGRRIWVVWHVSLMAGINVLMNIGQFQTGVLSQTFVFFTGIEVAIVLQWFAWRAKWSPHKTPVPSEDASLPHHRRDSARMPQWALWAVLPVFVTGILVRALVKPEWEWRWIWVAGVVFLAGVAFQRWRSARGKSLSVINPDTGAPRTPWAYGPFGRFVLSSLLVFHTIGVAVWLMPDKWCLSTFRPAARQVFAKWLTVTQTDQGWGMFAPNPPRSNVFLKVLVTDQKGEVFDLKTDVYAPERKPIPWIWNDRMRKMNRRIIGGESGNTQWYRKWYARYVCRQWALEHEGEGPKKVDLVKMWYRIPSPEETAKKGFYSPEKLLEKNGAEKIEHTENCQRTVMGQLPNFIRRRHGLDDLTEKWKYRAWVKHKKRKWEKRRAKERGEEPPKPEKKNKKNKKNQKDKKKD